MTDRRRKIEALRAKADSTTFPAEAAALRAKADELAAQEPKPYTPPSGVRTGFDAVDDWVKRNEPIFRQPPPQQTPRPADWRAAAAAAGFHRNLFEEMGGIRINFTGATAHDAGQRVQVTDVNGRTYWITVE